MNQDYQFSAAEKFFHQGEYHLAIDILKSLLSEDPNNAHFHGLLAACLLNDKRLYAAEYELGIALNLEPMLPHLLLMKAKVFIYKNKLKLALSECIEVLNVSPEYTQAFLTKSQVHLLLEQKNDALICLNNAVALEPDSVEVLTALGEYHLHIGQIKEAKEIALDALRLQAQDEEANVLMGKVQLALGNIEEAEYHAKFSIFQNPNSKAALTLFSNIKISKNLFLGLWWRFNSSISTLSNIKVGLILISAFLFFNLLTIILGDLEFYTLAKITNYVWLGVVVYSWVCLPIYYRQLKKELAQFRFNSNY